MEKHEFIFREINEREDLLQMLKLRYSVYNNTRHLQEFCPENNYGIDVDEYDIRARHFGLYVRENNREKVIGYMRVIENGLTPIADKIKAIALTNAPDLFQKINIIPNTPFPMIEHLVKGNIDIYRIIGNKTDTLREASRFIFLPEYRSKGLAKFMLDCVVGVNFYYFKIEKALLGCSLNHSRFYKSYGFKSIINGDNLMDLKGITNTIMFLTKNQIPYPIQGYLKNNAQQFSLNQCIKMTT